MNLLTIAYPPVGNHLMATTPPDEYNYTHLISIVQNMTRVVVIPYNTNVDLILQGTIYNFFFK